MLLMMMTGVLDDCSVLNGCTKGSNEWMYQRGNQEGSGFEIFGTVAKAFGNYRETTEI